MNRPLAVRLLGLSRRWASRLRLALARASGTEIGPDCQLGPGCDVQLGNTPERRGRLVLGARCALEQGVVLHPYGGSIVLGENIFLGPSVIVYGHGGVIIGDHTLVAMHCRIVSSNHAVPPPGTFIRALDDVPQPTRLGRDVWLGAGVTVLGGVTIGDGCIVGAGAVVTKDLPPNSIAFGVPARIVRQREQAPPSK